MFDVDFLVQINRLLPNRWRKPAMLAWLYRCIMPIQSLYFAFRGYRVSTTRRIRVTPQTYSLEWFLNFIFNPTFTPAMVDNSIDYSGGGIWIENNPAQLPVMFVYSDFDVQPPLYIYSEADPDPPVYIYSWDNYWEQYHFIVHVPTALAISEVYLRSIIDRYKPAGRRYTIETY